MKTIVYADLLFLINFIINLVILKTTCIFMKYRPCIWRIFAGALIGGLYAVCFFCPNAKMFYIFPFKILISMLMISITMPGYRIYKFIKSCAVFYLTSFSFAGIILAMIYFTYSKHTAAPVMDSGIFYFKISISTLIVSGLIVYILLWLVSVIFTKSKMIGVRKLKIKLGQNECVLSALCDTGNLLTDPISNLPVVIADKKSVMPLFPMGIPDTESGYTSGAKLRLIPYSSLGAKNEMMTGFVPDKVLLDCKTDVGVIIGISESALSETDEYNALFNPNIIN